MGPYVGFSADGRRAMLSGTFQSSASRPRFQQFLRHHAAAAASEPASYMASSTRWRLASTAAERSCDIPYVESVCVAIRRLAAAGSRST